MGHSWFAVVFHTDRTFSTSGPNTILRSVFRPFPPLSFGLSVFPDFRTTLKLRIHLNKLFRKLGDVFVDIVPDLFQVAVFKFGQDLH
jgi:hypothetical protein